MYIIYITSDYINFADISEFCIVNMFIINIQKLL
jgi:hypothetical protein